MSEIDELKQQLAQAQEEVARLKKRDGAPSRCLITGLPFFCYLESEDGIEVPTYGGPYDSYTIPEIDGDASKPLHEREFYRQRYCHDEGCWKETEIVGQRLIEDEALMKFEDLRAELTVAREECEHLRETHLEPPWDYDAMRKQRDQLRTEKEEFVEVVKECTAALCSCYDVTEFPANGKTDQDLALADARKTLAKHQQADNSTK